MAISEISQNTLVDQTILNQIIRAVNINADAVTNASSAIFNTSNSSQVTSYTGSWSVVTNSYTVNNHPISKNPAILNSKSYPLSFGKTFLNPPLVFVSLQALSGTGAGSSLTKIFSSAVVSEIKQSDCNVYVTIGGNSALSADSNLDFKISIMAIGLNKIE